MTMLDETARRLLDGRNFAVLATVRPDGSPQTSVMFVKRDGDAVLFSTIGGRQKARNLLADPRVSISVFDLENPYESVEIRGRAELVPDRHKRLPRDLTRKYLGTDPPADEPAEVKRVIVRVTPEKVVQFSAEVVTDAGADEEPDER
jgi:PPOX class probable F420-dependent enzyme